MSDDRIDGTPGARTSTTASPPTPTSPPAPATGGRSAPELKYLGIVFLGMNPDAPSEGKVLFQANKDRGYARSITDAPIPDQVRLGDTVFDLSNRHGIEAYVAALELAPAQSLAVARLLEDHGEDARDEVGQLALIYAQAERGERRMDRVVISGHSAGGMVWGDSNGIIMFDAFEELARIFPRAANQVRDVMFSACYTGGERYISQYRRMFPAVESIWAYSGSSPGTWSGAQVHLKIWERATEETEPAGLDPSLADGTRKGENVATWTLADGYKGAEPLTLEQAEATYEDGELLFQRYFAGEVEVRDPSTDPLREYYNTVQRLVSHPDISPDRWSEVQARRDVTLRLLFYALIRTRFSQSYAMPLELGYQEAGLPLPDYASLTRGNALREIAAFAAQARHAGTRATEAQGLLQHGLRDLEPALIPFTWI